MTATLDFAQYDSPMGRLEIVTHDTALVGLDFADNGGRLDRLMQRRFGSHRRSDSILPEPLRQWLDRYFAGDDAPLDGITIDPGGSAFEVRVWQALLMIPHGETRSYGALAQSLGRPKAARAVGRANGLNPISIIIPCHRVVGGDGKLTGYAGGLARKAWLLTHEGAVGVTPPV